jgi:hypothetical protein
MTNAAHGWGGGRGEFLDTDFISDPATSHPQHGALPLRWARPVVNHRGDVAAMPRTCTRCALHPVMEAQCGLCGACLGRELLGYTSRAQHTAAIKAAWEAGQRP